MSFCFVLHTYVSVLIFYLQACGPARFEGVFLEERERERERVREGNSREKESGIEIEFDGE